VAKRGLLQIIVPLVLFFGLALISFRAYQTFKIWDNSRIASEGVYKLSNEKSLKVQVTDDGFVDFWVSKGGTIIARSGERASTYQQWYMLWEFPAERLWFNSSDVGISMYAKNDTGTYQMYYVIPDEYMNGYEQTEADGESRLMVSTRLIPEVVWQKLRLHTKRPAAN